MHVPIIDFARYEWGQPESLEVLGGEVDSALSKIGFMSVTNLGTDSQLLNDVFAASRSFFASELPVKMECAYVSASENFGYQGLCEEHLDPTKPAARRVVSSSIRGSPVPANALKGRSLHPHPNRSSIVHHQPLPSVTRSRLPRKSDARLGPWKQSNPGWTEWGSVLVPTCSWRWPRPWS